MHPLRIFTWHVHGSYLYYLSQVPHLFYVPVKVGHPEGYGGRCGTLPWPTNLVEVPAEAVHGLELDAILFQSRKNYLEDQEILSPRQQRLPRLYLEHDPPRDHPTDTRHLVDDPNMLLVHVTPFNELMWDSGRTPTRVIEHGVMVPEGISYRGDLKRGIVVVNGLRQRGRRLGADLFERARAEIPLDLVGMQSEELGGLGEIRHDRLPALCARYRFFFNPIRYTSLGLAVCEAMMVGLPIVALATAEMATVIENGVSGFIDTELSSLLAHMTALLLEPGEARTLSAGARRAARTRFNIDRFIRDWCRVLAEATGTRLPRVSTQNLVR